MLAPGGNIIIDTLEPQEHRMLAPCLQRIFLTASDVVYGMERPITRVIFPVTCMLSKIKYMDDGSAVEVASIGREGISGVSLLLGSHNSSTDLVCSIEGSALAIDADAFLRCLRELPAFERRVKRFARAAYGTMAQIAACNRLHSIDARCARWLLSSGRRTGRDSYVVTHEELAVTLGSNRPAVTSACGALATAGLIGYHRGNLDILDSAGLERAACECYGAVEAMLGGLPA